MKDLGDLLIEYFMILVGVGITACKFLPITKNLFLNSTLVMDSF